MGLHTRTAEVDLVGSAGQAGGTAVVGISPSVLRGVQVKYFSQPGTVDVTVTGVLDGVEKQILGVQNNSADVPMTPVLQDAVGSAYAQTTDPDKTFPPLSGEVRTVVVQGDPATPGVKVTLLLER